MHDNRIDGRGNNPAVAIQRLTLVFEIIDHGQRRHIDDAPNRCRRCQNMRRSSSAEQDRADRQVIASRDLEQVEGNIRRIEAEQQA